MNVLNATQLFILKCLDILCEFHLNKKKYITKKVTGKQVYQTNQAERFADGTQGLMLRDPYFNCSK